MKNRLLSTRFLLLMTLVITLLPVSFVQAQTGNWQDAANVETTWYTTDPTKESFTISSEKELAGLAQLVNGNIELFAGKTIKLTEDLDLGKHYWTPIGNGERRFRGFFDGNGKTIANLYIDNSKNNESSVLSGLFGYIVSVKAGFIAGVKDLTLEGGEVIGGSGNYSYTGALVGYVSAIVFGGESGTIDITGITSTVAVSGSASVTESFTGGLIGLASSFGTFTLSGCINSGTVTGGKANNSSYTGGIIGNGTGIGDNSGSGTFTLSGCINTGTVTGGENDNSHTGGIIGNGNGNGFNNNGTVGTFTLSDSYNRGDVIASRGHAGGIAGYMVTDKSGNGNGIAIIRNCLSSGSVNNTDPSTNGSASTGGIVGTLWQANAGANPPVVENCLAIPASLTGKDGVPLRRIAGRKIGDTVTLTDNYAHVPVGTWTDIAINGLDGNNWTPPLAGTEWADNNPFTAWAFSDQADPTKPWLKEPVGNYLPILNTIALALQQPRTLFRFNGNGTSEHPFIIRTRTDLDLLSEEVNNGNSFAGQYLKLEPEDPSDVLDMGPDPFTPIGNSTHSFQGNFDGKNKTIANLHIDQSAAAGHVYAGLFGAVQAINHPVTIQNLTLQGGEVKGGGGGGGVTVSSTGALVGYIRSNPEQATLTNCHTLGIAVSGGANVSVSHTGGLAGNSEGLIVSACSNSGTVTGGDTGMSHTGGLIGNAMGITLNSCLNRGAVTGGKTGVNTDTGGLIGSGNGSSNSITNSYNTATIQAGKGYIGGLAGYINIDAADAVTRCWSSGTVTGGTATTGGLVGGVNNANVANPASLTHCLVVSGGITGSTDVHRIVGENTGDNNTEVTLSDNYTYVPAGTWNDKGDDKLDGADWTAPAIGATWTDGNPFSTWGFSDTKDAANPWLTEAVENYLPILNTVAAALQPRVAFRLKGSGTQGDAFKIRNRADFDFLSKQVNIEGKTFAGEYFELEPEDPSGVLDMGPDPFTPIGNSTNSFQGNFDGKNKTIANLHIDQSAAAGTVYTGLFGAVQATTHPVTIQNLTLQGGEVKGGGSGVANVSSTGALVGFISKNPAEVRITNCHTLGIAVYGGANVRNSYTGGLAGNSEGLIVSACSNSGTVTGGDTGMSHTGGLIGSTTAITLNSCLNRGAVTGGKTGGATSTGGLIGSGSSSPNSITNSYNTATIQAGTGYVGGLAGYIYIDAADAVTHCWSSGSVTGGTGATDLTGGLVGKVYNSNGAPTTSLTHCLVVSGGITGGATTHRIVGENTGMNNIPVTLSGNYAHVPAGTWTDKGHDKPNGADWNGLMTSAPISDGANSWDNTTVWTIDPNDQIMPKLKAIDGSLQPDVKNPLKNTLPPNPNPNPTPTPGTIYKVSLSLLLDNPDLASCVTLYPDTGTYDVESGQNMVVLVFLHDDCDLSDVKMTANGDTIIAEEKKNELRAIAYTFRIPITEATEIKVIGIQRNNTIGTTQPSEGAKVWTSDGHIHVRQAESRKQEAGGEVRIYTITGQLLVKESMPSHLSPLTFHLPKGIYLLVIDDEVFKVKVEK